MSRSPERDGFEIQVRDFGPIVDATIDLRPFTVFIGPSNTGKSYLAILIYALHQFFGGSWPAGRSFPRRFRIHGSWDSSERTQKILRSLASERFLDRLTSDSAGTIVLPSAIAEELRAGFDRTGTVLSREIGRCFGIDQPGALTRIQGRHGAHVLLRRHNSADDAPVEHSLTLSGSKSEFRTTIPTDRSIPLGRDPGELRRSVYEILHFPDNDPEERRDDERTYLVGRMFDILSSLILPHVAGPLRRAAYYLPADRTGVMHAHSVVVSALIGRAPTAGLRPATRTAVLSGVLADFLEYLIEIDRPRFQRRRRQFDYGAKIEKTILDGSVGVERSAYIDYPSFTYRPKGWKNDLPLMNASSMVSELAPVVLYLRHLVQPGHVLIVEEPESHLHPAMQVKLTRQLAALVRNGIRVIVTTHSEWLLEELANIVRRSEIPGSKQTKNVDDEVALDSREVGAWLFEPKRRPKGSIVSEIRLDESGLYPSGFEEVAAALHNDWADISSRIGDGG